MLQIVPFTDERLAETVSFLSRLNGDPTHEIGYLGQGEAEVAHDLAELTVPLRDSFWLAEADGRLMGVIGFDADRTLGRAWIMGPFVDGADWQATAAALYARLVAGVPAGVDQWELFGHVANRNLADFAQANGYRALTEAHLLELARPAELPAANPAARDLPDGLHAAFSALHETAFPNTYYSAEQLLALRDARHRLLALVEGEQLAGYAFLQLRPEVREAYLDFLAVGADLRGRGAGRSLLAAVVRAAFEQPETDRLMLTVNGDNEPALRLYRADGFTVARTLRGYRRVMPPDRGQSGANPNVPATTPGNSA